MSFFQCTDNESKRYYTHFFCGSILSFIYLNLLWGSFIRDRWSNLWIVGISLALTVERFFFDVSMVHIVYLMASLLEFLQFKKWLLLTEIDFCQLFHDKLRIKLSCLGQFWQIQRISSILAISFSRKSLFIQLFGLLGSFHSILMWDNLIDRCWWSIRHSIIKFLFWQQKLNSLLPFWNFHKSITSFSKSCLILSSMKAHPNSLFIQSTEVLLRSCIFGVVMVFPGAQHFLHAFHIRASFLAISVLFSRERVCRGSPSSYIILE